MGRIRQLYVSPSVMDFKERMKRKYDLTSYKDPYKPLVIFGMYIKSIDYEVFKNHKGKIVVVWCGNDSNKIDEPRAKILLRRKDTVHYAMSRFISDDLKKWNIPHKMKPITPTSSDLTSCPRGDKIYHYHGSDAKKDFYGYPIAQEVGRITGIEVVHATSKTYDRGQLLDVYRDCFIGLRLTAHDGLPNTVVELGLMGRRSIYNGGIACSIPWVGVEDICENVLKEYETRKEPNEHIGGEMKKFITMSDKWLRV